VSRDELAALRLERLQWSLNHAYGSVHRQGPARPWPAASL